jgi:hypothetical protein
MKRARVKRERDVLLNAARELRRFRDEDVYMESNTPQYAWWKTAIGMGMGSSEIYFGQGTYSEVAQEWADSAAYAWTDGPR